MPLSQVTRRGLLHSFCVPGHYTRHSYTNPATSASFTCSRPTFIKLVALLRTVLDGASLSAMPHVNFVEFGGK